ncbi:hypothetical protein BKA69DRAFT_1125863 [Paraphysoderma sedebokerense]|nr:hypothetical protein BKA69DRAFT_1125863 [Paraphysoderma sedebokerense]
MHLLKSKSLPLSMNFGFISRLAHSHNCRFVTPSYRRFVHKLGNDLMNSSQPLFVFRQTQLISPFSHRSLSTSSAYFVRKLCHSSPFNLILSVRSLPSLRSSCLRRYYSSRSDDPFSQLSRPAKIGISVGAGFLTFLFVQPILGLLTPIVGLAVGYGVYRFARSYFGVSPYSDFDPWMMNRKNQKDRNDLFGRTSASAGSNVYPPFAGLSKMIEQLARDFRVPLMYPSSHAVTQLHRLATDTLVQKLQFQTSQSDALSKIFRYTNLDDLNFTRPFMIDSRSMSSGGLGRNKRENKLTIVFGVASKSRYEMGDGIEVEAVGEVEQDSGRVFLRRLSVVDADGRKVNVDVDGRGGSGGVVDGEYEIK